MVSGAIARARSRASSRRSLGSSRGVAAHGSAVADHEGDARARAAADALKGEEVGRPDAAAARHRAGGEGETDEQHGPHAAMVPHPAGRPAHGRSMEE